MRLTTTSAAGNQPLLEKADSSPRARQAWADRKKIASRPYISDDEKVDLRKRQFFASRKSLGAHDASGRVDIGPHFMKKARRRAA